MRHGGPMFMTPQHSLEAASRNSTPRILGPGYNGGTVVIGKDPGGFADLAIALDGSKQKKTAPRDEALDARLEDALLALPTAGDAVTAVSEVSRLFLDQMPYNGMQVILGQISERLHEPIEHLAFFNLCPYRTRGPSLMRGLREVAVKLVPALDAHTVPILNSPVAKDLATIEDPTLGAKWPPQIVYRMRRDRQGLQAQGLQALDALAHDPEWRRQRGRE